MEIFLDTAQVDEIRRATAWGVVTGVTTNPTLMARAGGDPETVLKTIAQLVPGPVSAEVIATDARGWCGRDAIWRRWPTTSSSRCR